MLEEVIVRLLALASHSDEAAVSLNPELHEHAELYRRDAAMVTDLDWVTRQRGRAEQRARKALSRDDQSPSLFLPRTTNSGSGSPTIVRSLPS